MEIVIRAACEADVVEITAIYNHAVANTTAIWNETVVDAANRLGWLVERERAGYPVLVAVDDAGTVLGYASFGDWRAWDGYRHTVEHSVYVRSDRQGGGVGQALLRSLIDHARMLGKHVMVAGVEAGNTTSIALHTKLGFEQTGVLREVGAKFGNWLDLTFLTLRLDGSVNPPERPAPAQ